MSRRSVGEGSISQRGDGRWQASIQVFGIRRTVYAATEREARQKLTALRRQVVLQNGLESSGTRTVNDLLDAWLDVSADHWKPTTLWGHRKVCNQYIRPALGGVRLSRLSPIQIQSLTASLHKANKPRTALKIHAALHRACELAVLWGWLTQNPCKRAARPQYRPERKEVWTHAQVGTFLHATERHWLGPLWAFLVASGCRLGEALGLRWECVNLEAGTVAIGGNLQRVGKQWVFQGPKTTAGQRTVTLPPWGVAAIKRQKVQQAEWRLRAGGDWLNEWGLVFTRENGRPLQGTNVARALRETSARLALPQVSPHGLRHLHASLLLDAGVSIPQVSRRLGHADARVTLSVYSHVIRQDDEAAQALTRIAT